MSETMPSPLMCWAPQFVCATIMMSSTPSSHTAMSSDRMTLPKGCDTSAPATLMIFASPFLSPSAAMSSSVRRVSMHDTTASFLSGYLSVLNFSYARSSTKRALCSMIWSIVVFSSMMRGPFSWLVTF